MSSYLRPRRGKNATAISQLGANAPLKRGEVFFEVPDAGVGTGLGKIKMGDGSSAYANLPYFLEQLDLDNAKVAFTDSNTADENPYTTNTTLATAIAPTASMKTIFTNLKQLLVNHNAQLTQLNNETFRGYVEVLGNGSKTWRALFNELYALVDKSRLTPNTKLALVNAEGSFSFYNCLVYDNTRLYYTSAENYTTEGLITTAYFSSSSTFYREYIRAGVYPSIQNIGDNAPANGVKIRIYY